MPSFSNKLAFVVPTKDHPKDLRSMFESLARQSCFPDQIILVDGGDETVESVVQGFPTLNIQYLRVYPPSLAKQRNAGMAALDPAMTLAGYLDDDLILEPDAIESMLTFWEQAPEDVGGARFNIITESVPQATRLQSLFLIDSPKGGAVLRSGQATMIRPVKENQYVQWLSGGATVWRKQVVEEFAYDEWFLGTGYLEDVDYSYRVGRKYKLVVVADARVQHFTHAVRKELNYVLGKWQVVNRLYFVKKNPEFSRLLFGWALVGQLVFNAGTGIVKMDNGFLRRALGNCAGLFMVARGRMDRIGGVYK